MEPVWPILRLDEHPDPDEGDDTTVPEPDPNPSIPSTQRLMELYGDPDGAWADRLSALYRYDWAAVPTAERSGLGRFFVQHPDPAVRDRICSALAAWDMTDQLLQLAHDPISWVRKSAVYHLQFVRRSREVADLAWDLIVGGEVASTRGHETLRTYSVHAPPDEATANLSALALTDLRESIRYEAVYILDDVRPVLPSCPSRRSSRGGSTACSWQAARSTGWPLPR